MTEIFVSHAVADKELADRFVAFLKEAIGVPAKAIFCSSIDGQNIPLGYDFNQYMKQQIQSPQLVILLMTPRYMESWFCLMELGATWAKSLRALPIVVPPVRFAAISETLGLTQGWRIDNDAKLVDLRQAIQTTNLNLEHRTEHDWDKKRAAWKVELKKLLKRLSLGTNVSASDHKLVQDELYATRSELSGLQAAYEEAIETIDELKAAKDAAAVKAIMSKKAKGGAQARFDELLEAVSKLRPRVSLYFYRNMIMDFYGKPAEINWYDNEQKADAEAAIQYNLMEADQPHGFLWNERKLQKIAAALRSVGKFLESEEAAGLVKMLEKEGHPTDVDDLEFWEYHLP